MGSNNDVRKLIEKGKAYLDKKDFDEALKEFNNVLSIDKNNEDALLGKITSFRKLFRLKEAHELTDEALTKYPKNVKILNERGRLYYKQQQYAEAVKAFDDVLNIDEKDKDALQWKIDSLRLDHKFEEADKCIKGALAKYPDDVDILNERARLYYCQQEYDKAIEALNVVLNKDENNEDARQGKIASLVWLDRLEDARQSAKVALKMCPNSPKILTAVSALCLYSNKPIKSKEYLDKAVKFAPEDTDVRNERGLFYIRQNDWNKAKEEFEHIHKKDPNNVMGFLGLGRVYLEESCLEEAETKFREGLKIKTYCPKLLTSLAWVLVQKESKDSPEQAQETSETTYVLGQQGSNDSQPRIYNGKGCAWPNEDEAEQHLKKSLMVKCNPNYHAYAYGCLGIIAFRRKRIRESENYLRQSIEVKNSKAGSYVGLGKLYLYMGRYTEAKTKLKEALEIDQYDVKAHIELGNLYLQTDRIKEAIPEFHQAKVIDPTNEEAPRLLAGALMQTGEFNKAEEVLRDAIKSMQLRRIDESKRWRLHLMLSRLLVNRGDMSNNDRQFQFYKEALMEVNKAKHFNPKDPDPYFYRGVILCRFEDYGGAIKDFEDCLNKSKQQNKQHLEAESWRRHVRSHLRDIRSKSNFWGRVGIIIIAMVQLVALWFLYFTGKVMPTTLTIMLPILLGLTVLACLLPLLTKLKLPGLEAELSQPKEAICEGPTCEDVPDIPLATKFPEPRFL